MLSFVSAFLQAITAILVMALVFLVLRGTSVSMTDATWFLEVASYLLITLFGAWLLWQKAGPRLAVAVRRQPGLQPVGRARAFASHAHAMRTRMRIAMRPIRMDIATRKRIRTAMRGMIIRGTIMRRITHGHEHHHHAAGEVCETCGHSHAPDPAMLSGDRFSWKTAWSAVAAVGLRPCSGALIVLTFAFLNGLFVGGVLSVFAMAVGTAITVSVLATIAVTAKNWAVAYAGDGRAGQPRARDDRDRRRGAGVRAGAAAA